MFGVGGGGVFSVYFIKSILDSSSLKLFKHFILI